MAGAVTVREVADRSARNAFLRVPFRVHAGDPAWVPPLFMEQRKLLDRKRNPYFEHADASFWIAERGGEAVGRISAQVDRLAADGEGHFGMLSTPDEPDTVAALLGTAEAWLKERGCRSVVGPYDLSINHESGLLIDGFDRPPMLLMRHDPPHLGPLVAACGYDKAKDLYAYLCDSGGELPAQVEGLLTRALSDRLRLRPLNMRRYADEIRLLTEIFNDAWHDNWGFVPMTTAEVETMAQDMRPLIDSRMIWFLELDGNAFAFAVCLPNLNEAIRDLGGRLLPFGWARLLWRLKVLGLHTARVPLMGVRRLIPTLIRGIAPFLVVDAIRRETRRRGMSEVELSWILEDNKPVIGMVEKVGGRHYKTYRLYRKAL